MGVSQVLIFQNSSDFNQKQFFQNLLSAAKLICVGESQVLEESSVRSIDSPLALSLNCLFCAREKVPQFLGLEFSCFSGYHGTFRLSIPPARPDASSFSLSSTALFLRYFITFTHRMKIVVSMLDFTSVAGATEVHYGRICHPGNPTLLQEEWCYAPPIFLWSERAAW